MENEPSNSEQEKNLPDQLEEPSPEQPGWFQDFVEQSDPDNPQQGEILKGKILDIQAESVLVDVGFKKDAIVPGTDLDRIDPDYRKKLQVGDEVFVSVIRTPLGDDDLLVSISRGLTHETWLRAEQLGKKADLVELVVVDQNRGGLLVAFETIQGFIPNSHIPSIRRGTSTRMAGEIKSELIGKRLPLKVIEVIPQEHKLVFSARVAQEDQRQKRITEIEIGEIFKSRIVNVVDFGIFVDLDGVDGLVHKSEVDWERVTDLKKRFKIGEEIEVQVLDIEKDQERVSLSRKKLLPNPWLNLAEKNQINDLVEGKVVSVVEFGAFVELPDGLQGLVHVSELGYLNTGDPKSTVKVGDPVLVKIMGIDPKRERVSLSMRRVPVSEQMEWMMALEDVAGSDLLDSTQEEAPDPGLESDPEPLGTTLEEDGPENEETLLAELGEDPGLESSGDPESQMDE